MAKLVFIGEKFVGRIYEFALPTTTVGRGDHNTLTIHDASVSQTHCEILVFGDEVIVRDLGSSNGTSVNGVRFRHQQRPLLGGQIVKFGSVEARLELESPGAADSATDMTAIHSHGQLQREHRAEPKPPATPSLSLEADTKSAQADHTLLLTRPSESEITSAPPPTKPGDAERPRKWRGVAWVVAGLVLGLALLLWLLW